MQKYDLQIFHGLDDAFKDEINRSAKLVTFKKNQIPFLDNELMHHFYIIVDGTMKTYQLNLDNSKEQTISILQSGDMFDTITLLDGKPHEVMYEAIEDTTTLQIPIENVRAWIKNNDAFNQKFFPYIASQLRHTEELATDLSLYDTYHRLIKLILQSLNPQNKNRYNLIHNLSHTEIAKMIGTVRHVVERHLKKLKDAGIIKTDRKYLEVRDMKKLVDKL
jgi:CRP-like cAMP-binding protein